MPETLQEKLNKLKDFPVWEFEETILLLTGDTPARIKYSLSQQKPPKDLDALGQKAIKMLVTEVGTHKTGSYNMPFPKDEICIVPINVANKWIEKGSAENLNKSDAYQLEYEKKLYLNTQSQLRLIKIVERATIAQQIKLLPDANNLDSGFKYLEVNSFLQWASSHWNIISPLRHFPDYINDVLAEIIQDIEECKSTNVDTIDDKDKIKPKNVKESDYFFRKLNDDAWQIKFQEGLHTVKHTDGMQYIHFLLMRPWKKIPSPNIYSNDEVLQVYDNSAVDDTVLDSEAIKQYRQRIKELEKETYTLENALKKLDADGDIENLLDEKKPQQKRKEIIDKIYERKQEISSLESQINNNIRPDRKLKIFDDSTDKTRSKVTKAIGTAIKNISRASPELGAYIDKNIDTGRECCYIGSIIWTD